MKIYNYDSHGFYIGEDTADESPLEAGVYLIPALATTMPPPETDDNSYVRFVDDEWTIFKMQIVDDRMEQEPQPTIEEQLKHLSSVVRMHMHTKVQEKDYDNIISACSYISSTNDQFREEAQKCIEWRDNVWEMFHAITQDVHSRLIEVPTEEDLIKMLPELIW
jgi:hypothetical protein